MEIKDGVLIKVEPEDLIDGTFTIPDTVIEIGEEACRKLIGLKRIKIPDSVKTIEENAFTECYNLTEVVFPKRLRYMYTNTFNGCISLESIKIPPEVLIMSVADMSEQEDDYYNYDNDDDDYYDDDYYDDDWYDDDWYKSLETVEPNEQGDETPPPDTPDATDTVQESNEDKAEPEDEVLPNLNLDDNRNELFQGCINLRRIEVDEDSEAYVAIDGILYSKSLDVLVKYPPGRKEKSYTIPANVKRVEEYAISNNHLTTIEILGEFKQGLIPELDGNDTIICCNNLDTIILPENITEEFLMRLAFESGIEYGITQKILFGEYYERMQKVKAKDNFKADNDYDEDSMNKFYFKMINSIGIDEVERIVELPQLTSEEVKKYLLEQDAQFQELFETKYKITGNLGIALRVLKQLQINNEEDKKNKKNNFERKLFRGLNRKIEEGYDGTFIALIENVIKEEKLEVPSDFLDKIKKIEKRINKELIKDKFREISSQIEYALSQPNEQYEEVIVTRQISPIIAMVESVVVDIFKENGHLDLETLKIRLEEKIGNANAPYIRQKKDQIIHNVLNVLGKEENFNKLNYSCTDALRETKESIGGVWKYKINQALLELGYTFDNLPALLSKEEIEKLGELLGIQETVGIETVPIATPRKESSIIEAYELLLRKSVPNLVTYKQIHDMFGSVHPPYSEKFKEFFKKHRKEFLENPKYYAKFGQIHNNFEMTINSSELKNIYKQGELTIDAILAFFDKVTFKNQLPGEEELAKLSMSVGEVTTEKEFEFVKKIFHIMEKRERTTIPPTTVTKSKFRGRMLSPDDILNLFVGDITTCCQRFGDVGEAAMLLGAIEENGGIFVIEELDENGNVVNIVGQSLTIRQKGPTGEFDRLTFDNIEISMSASLSKDDEEEILSIYQEAGKQAIERDKKFLDKLLKQGKITQEQYDRMVLKEVIVGTGYNDLDGIESLPEAQLIAPDESHFRYKTMNGYTLYPWIDSAGEKSSGNGNGKAVILTTMEENELAEIKKRIETNPGPTVKTSDVPLWYGRIGKVEHITKENCKEEHLKKIKQIRKKVYSDKKKSSEFDSFKDMSDIEFDYDIKNSQIRLGSNNDWYVIYGEYVDGVKIVDFAVKDGIHAEYNQDETNNGNSKLAILEATNELYGILLELGKSDKKIYCDVESDAMVVNLMSCLRKGLIELETTDGKEIQYQRGIGLVYAENGKKVERETKNKRGELECLSLQIKPNIEKLREAKKRVDDLLQRVRDTVRMIGTEKEEGLDELRAEIRSGTKAPVTSQNVSGLDSLRVTPDEMQPMRRLIEESAYDISNDTLEFVKSVENQAYPEAMKLMQNIDDIENFEYVYGYPPSKLTIARNNDWYIIYGENEESLEILDIASLPNRDRNASRQEMYNYITRVINQKAHNANKTVTLNAKEDTSYRMIQRMVSSGDYEILEDTINTWETDDSIVMHDLVLKPNIQRDRPENH